MSIERDKIIERLKKLFALGQSPNQHEAEAAMAKANEIMTEYQISVSDVDLLEDGDVEEDSLELDEGKKQLWISSLAFACAQLYDCRTTYNNTSRHTKGLNLSFYGTSADVMASKMTFNHLYASWKSIVNLAIISHGPYDKKVYRRSHGMGFTDAINKRVTRLVAERQAKVKSATGRDLVIVKGVAVDDFMKDIKLRDRSPHTVYTDDMGLMQGTEAGRHIPLHGAINKDAILAISKG